MTELWEEVKRNIQNKVSKPSYETWIANTTATLVDNTLTVVASNAFARDWLVDHYAQLIDCVVTEITGQTYQLVFVTEQDKEYVKVPSIFETPYETVDKVSLCHLVQQQGQLISELQKKVEELELRVQELEKST